MVLGLVAGVLASGACYRAIATAYLGGQTGWRDSLRYAARRFHSLLWVTLLTFLFALLGLVACVIPGVYLWAGFAVAVPVLLTEDRRGLKALGRSRDLVSGFWWRTFGVIVLGAILGGIVSAALEGVIVGLTSIGPGSGTSVWVVGNIVSGTLAKAVATPFTAAFVTVLYFDLRVRKEAFDLQLLADRLGVDPPPGWSPPPDPVQSSRPPFWPPPPGWTPGAPEPAPPPAVGQDAPPFWPPPPGWRPGGGAD